MIKHILGAVALVLLAACTTSEGVSPTSTVAAQAPAPASDRSAFVGTWSGSLQSGERVVVSVPEIGNATYTFNGQRFPVSSTRVSGTTMTLRVLQATITLSPSGNQMGFQYQLGGNRAAANLSRS